MARDERNGYYYHTSKITEVLLSYPLIFFKPKNQSSVQMLYQNQDSFWEKRRSILMREKSKEHLWLHDFIA